jgi:cell division protein FtsB|tara:strand:- start:689 stop:1027 length:339 start_codon:yes stop_codon:yes gene_type:complete
MRLITTGLVIFFLLLQYRLWFGKNSVPDYISLQSEVVRQKIDNEKLKQRNKLLYADTDDLKLGLEAIEERSRNELGMIKQGETFFRIVPSHPSQNNKQDRTLTLLNKTQDKF